MSQSHEVLVNNEVNSVIRAVLRGTIPSEPSGVRLAATKALLNAKLLSHILKQLGHALDCPEIDDGREKQAKLQLSLCSLLQFLVHKLSGTDKTKHLVLQKSDAIMTLFFRVLACHQSSGEAMLATGSLACATGPAFEKYLPDLFNYLKVGLENFKECSVTVGVVGDICGAIHDKILPFCDQIMSLLLHNLQSDALPTSVKPLIFSCIGDIALAIGGHFSERYLTPALQIIMQGAEAEVSSDEELMDYANQLRKSILKAYSGIPQGCEDAKAEFMMPYLLQFINLDDAQNGRGRDGRSCRRIGQKTRQLLENSDVCGEAAKEMREYRG